MYVENIIIGSPVANPVLMFALDDVDWHNTEKDKTYYTNERFFAENPGSHWHSSVCE